MPSTSETIAGRICARYARGRARSAAFSGAPRHFRNNASKAVSGAFAALAGVATLGLLAVFATGAARAAENFTFTPLLEVTEEYSSNVDLEPRGDEDDAFSTRVTPGFQLRGRSARVESAIDAGVTVKHQSAGDDDGITEDVNLTANNDFEIVRERLFLETGASISQQVLAATLANSDANQETVQTYRVSPVFRSHLGGTASAEVRYDLEHVELTQGVSDQTTHRGSIGLESGEMFHRFQWGFDASVSQSMRSNDHDVNRVDVTASGDYGLTRWLHLLGEAGYQRFDDGTRTEFDSPVLVGGILLKPDKRTELEARFGLRNDGPYASARYSYQFGPRTTFSVVYDETLSTAQERLSNAVAALGVDGETNGFVDQRSDDPFNPKTDPFDIGNETSKIQRITMTIGRTSARTTMALRGSVAHEEKQGTSADETNARIDLNLARRLTRKTTAQASFGYERFEFADGQKDNEFLASASLVYQVWRNVDLTMSYFFSTQDSTQPLSECTSHRVLVGIRRRF